MPVSPWETLALSVELQGHVIAEVRFQIADCNATGCVPQRLFALSPWIRCRLILSNPAEDGQANHRMRKPKIPLRMVMRVS